jgi:hypothetical protein
MVVLLFGVGAALLGFWVVLRYPSLGPQTLGSALITALAFFVLQTPLLAFVDPVIASAGVPTALLLVILPSLTLLFWSSGCLVRALVGLISPHHR